MILAKYHQSERDLLLAACDSDLIGKTIILENGAEVKILESFYKDKIVSEEELIIMAKECTTGNFFGKETINALTKAGIIFKESTMDLKGVPHSQLYKFF
ncbi:MAG: DUF424 family protein [Candidatus Nanoarchaeia archaeon]|nr:DUF424 family protein [Candidatus Nanoarchaeia archaeon]